MFTFKISTPKDFILTDLYFLLTMSFLLWAANFGFKDISNYQLLHCYITAYSLFWFGLYFSTNRRALSAAWIPLAIFFNPIYRLPFAPAFWHESYFYLLIAFAIHYLCFRFIVTKE